MQHIRGFKKEILMNIPTMIWHCGTWVCRIFLVKLYTQKYNCNSSDNNKGNQLHLSYPFEFCLIQFLTEDI